MKSALSALPLIVTLALVGACGSDDEGGGGSEPGATGGSSGVTSGSGGASGGSSGGAIGSGATGVGGGASGVGGGGAGADAAPPPPPANPCDQLTAACGSAVSDDGDVMTCLETGEAGDEEACMTALDGCRTACGDAICALLQDLCGSPDTGRGAARNCARVAQTADGVACFERAQCIETCSATQRDGGEPDAGGAADASIDGSPESGAEDAATD